MRNEEKEYYIRKIVYRVNTSRAKREDNFLEKKDNIYRQRVTGNVIVT